MKTELPEEPKAVRDFFKYNFAANESALEEARTSFRATLERRDRLLDRMRFGALSLNGVTLLAGLSRVAEDFVLKPGSSAGAISIGLFVVGIVCSMLSMQREHVHLIGLASEQDQRMNALMRLSFTLKGEISSQALTRVKDEMDEIAEHPPKDHTLDEWGMRLIYLSASAWFSGLLFGLGGA